MIKILLENGQNKFIIIWDDASVTLQLMLPLYYRTDMGTYTVRMTEDVYCLICSDISYIAVS